MTDREPASMSEASNPCVIWECIYDHGNGKFMGAASQAQRDRAFAELRRLHAENEALREDAERYRWLRDMASQDWIHRNHNYQSLRGVAFDAAIDAARKEST